MTDRFFGNSVTLPDDVKVSLSLSNQKILQIPNQITIPAGKSFAETSITIRGNAGEGDIMANSINFGTSSVSVQVGDIKKFQNKLDIFVNYPSTQFEVNVPVEVKINVNDQNFGSVEGATLKFISNTMAIFPTSVLTDNEGTAFVMLTPEIAPEISLIIQASKVGYLDDEKTAVFSVVEPSLLSVESLINIIIIVVVIVVAIVSLRFILKRRQKPDVDEYEEYEETI